MIKNRERQFAVMISIILAIFLGGTHINEATAQNSRVLSASPIFENDETFQYKLIFKWGIIRGRVGEATLTNKKINSGQQYFTQVHVRSVGIGDAFFRVRDTLETLYSSDFQPLRFEKRADENDYKMVDEISFKHSPSVVRASAKGYRNGELKVDTVYTYDPRQYEVIDMLSAIALVRGFDFTDPANTITGKRLVIPIGNAQAYTECIYDGTEEMKKPDGTKVNAIVIKLNIQDEAFKTQENSVTAWISDDEQKLPLKVEANLKIGRVVVELVSYHSKKS